MMESRLDTTTRRRLDGLLTLLRRLEELHHELGALLLRKFASMRDSQFSEMQRCSEQEEIVTARVQEQEGLRRQLMEQLGRSFGFAPQTARSMPARQFAARLEEPYRGSLVKRAEQIRAAVDTVKERNRLVQRVSEEVLNHLEAIFNSVRQPDGSAGAYSAKGRNVAVKQMDLFEAVG